MPQMHYTFTKIHVFSGVALVAEWYRYRTVACLVTSSSPVPLKTHRVEQRCTLHLSRAETSSRWCGVVVRRGVPAQLCRRKQRSAFDQVSEFDRGRIVAYRDCGLSFREIGSRAGRNQTTAMRICDRWMRICDRTDVVDRIHLSAPLHVRTGKLTL
ncbi:uncharacterized protein TNCV_805701 [Trichonephila clavipes]|nr:uncharacterized protein TNCV_805701 [Trichonephila clavipes]